MERIVTILILVLLIGAGCAQESTTDENRQSAASSDDNQKPNLAGRYSYTGTNPDGSPYVGQWVVELIETDATYQVIWTQAGEEPSLGIAVFDDGKLVIGYDQAADLPGVSILRPTSDGGLTGEWTVTGQNRIGRETWTRIE